MNFNSLMKANRILRKRKGQRIETRSAFFLRYYVTTTDEKGASIRKQECVKLADKSDTYRSWKDVQPLIARVLENVNQQADLPTGKMSLSDFIEKHYFPWVEKNKAASTVHGYKQVWGRYLKPSLGGLALVNLQTVHVTAVLTKHAESGKGSRTLSHMKWMLSGVYQYGIATGVIPNGSNPVEAAHWMHKVRRVQKQKVYTLAEVLSILRVLAPIDVRAAVAVALAYFAALRPSEIRGLMWSDYHDGKLYIRRSVWRSHVGETKTEESEASVFVIEPLLSLLERLRALSDGQGYILKNGSNKPLSLDSLNWRTIMPAMKEAGIDWHGFYPCRRGMSSITTEESKDALTATGLLRHASPITTLKHYTRAQEEAIISAMRQVETKALAMMKEPKLIEAGNGG